MSSKMKSGSLPPGATGMNCVMIAAELVVAGEAEKPVVAGVAPERIVALGSHLDVVVDGHVGFLRSAAGTRGIFR